MNNLETRLVQSKDQKKTKNLHNRIKLSKNENTQWPETKTTLNLLDISKITRTIY